MGDQAYQNFQQHQQQYQNEHNTQLGSIVDLNPVFQEINNIDQGYINIQPPPTVNAPIIPTQKTFKYANDCSISIGCTPSGFTTILLHIRDTPYFGVGTIYSLSALELKDATIYYNSKHDFLLEEDIDPNSISPLDLDKDRRLHKICIYKLNETGEYRIDFVKLAKTGIEELDRQDPWKDFNDMRNQGAGDRQVEMMRKFINILSTSRNEPDIIVTSSIPEKSPDLKPCVGIMEFKRVQ